MPRANLLNLCVISLFAVAACNLPVSQQTAPAPTAAPPPPVAAPNAAGAQPSAPTTLATPVGQIAGTTAPAAAAPPLQTTATVEGQPVAVQIIELKRVAGNMLMLRLALTNQGGNPINRVYGYATVIDTYLVDPAGGKKYEVIRDKMMNALASEMNALNLTPGTRQEAYAQFTAPPPAVASINVHVPGAAPLVSVPITP